MIRKILVLIVCMLLISTVLPVTGAIMFEKNAISTINDGTLSGYVNDTSMNPIEGALVQVSFHGTCEEDYTDSSGYYHVTNIPICYCLKNCTASKSGYKSECVLLSIVENTTYDFVLASGNTLYVGGSGPNNYTKIQDAIDDANNGDIVFVYDNSSPYNEIVFLGEDKSISLLGEDRETTVIDGNQINRHVVEIRADGVEFSGFTVQNCGHYAGLMVITSDNYIHDCNFYNNPHGLHLQSGIRDEKPYTKNNIIVNNCFENNSWGMYVSGNTNCTIIENIVINNEDYGIILSGGSNNNIRGNIVKNNRDGLHIHGKKNMITNNLIQNNLGNGIEVHFVNLNVITKNNFIENGPNGYEHASFYQCWWQLWNSNYWNPRRRHTADSTMPFMVNQYGPFISLRYPLFNFDWHPAQDPYVI